LRDEQKFFRLRIEVLQMVRAAAGDDE
jgi:hypothetical protein